MAIKNKAQTPPPPQYNHYNQKLKIRFLPRLKRVLIKYRPLS